MFVFISLSSRVGRREKGEKQMWSFLNFFFPQNEFINEESQNLILIVFRNKRWYISRIYIQQAL